MFWAPSPSIETSVDTNLLSVYVEDRLMLLVIIHSELIHE